MVRQGASHMCDGSAHSSGHVVNGLMLCMRMREGYCSWCVSVCPLVYSNSHTSQSKTKNTHGLSGKRVFR